jgi:putative hemolysin
MNAKYIDDARPLMANCPCPACTHYNRAYLNHLFKANEMLGPMLLTWHNLTFYQHLMQDIRAAIGQRRLAAFAEGFLANYREAQDEADRRACYRLRFQVFNVELGEGLDHALSTGEDTDVFDPVCDHLLVQHEPTGLVVGTYRLQSGATAALHHGYYSEQEFEFAPFESIRDEVIELGRACVHQDFRNYDVINLLWHAISKYADETGGRYLIGCSSLTSQDSREGWATYQRLKQHLAPLTLQTKPTSF